MNPHRNTEDLERQLAGKPRTRRQELIERIEKVKGRSSAERIRERMEATFDAVRRPCAGELMRQQRNGQ